MDERCIRQLSEMKKQYCACIAAVANVSCSSDSMAVCNVVPVSGLNPTSPVTSQNNG